VFVIEFDVQFYDLVLYGGVHVSAFKNFCDDGNYTINGGEQMALVHGGTQQIFIILCLF
jgi:hypothetical protein